MEGVELLETPSTEDDGAITGGNGEYGAVDGLGRGERGELVQEFVACRWDADDYYTRRLSANQSR